MPIEIAFAGDGSLAADVEHPERAHLAGVRDADGHAVLLLHGRIGRGRLHASELDRRRLSRVAGRQARRGLHRRRVFGVVGKKRRRHLLGHELIAGAVVGLRAIDVRLHQRPARELAS